MANKKISLEFHIKEAGNRLILGGYFVPSLERLRVLDDRDRERHRQAEGEYIAANPLDSVEDVAMAREAESRREIRARQYAQEKVLSESHKARKEDIEAFIKARINPSLLDGWSLINDQCTFNRMPHALSLGFVWAYEKSEEPKEA